AVDDVPEKLQVSPIADHTKIQVIPPGGESGTYSFRYTITDGRKLPDGGIGTASAGVTVEVVGNDVNTAPKTRPDRVEVAGGSVASVNALRNDTDPENDAIVLESVADDGEGQVTFDASGQVSYTPSPTTTRGTVDLQYTARDTLGSRSTGRIRVFLRPVDTNNEPKAEDDSRVTVVGRPIAFNVLVNDSDPDNDPLSVGTQLDLLSGSQDSLTGAAMSPDGEFYFEPAQPGSYVFSYDLFDSREQDEASIRVDVLADEENNAPVAVRDDITISRGSSRIAYVLQNDFDPDGDVIAIEGWTPVDGVRIEETLGSGLNIKLTADAPDMVPILYTVTDGTSDPAGGRVIVAASDKTVVDQPPVLKPDLLDIRPGRTGTVRVLINDYDPEGGALSVVRTANSPKADVRIGPGGQDIYVTLKRNVRTSFSFGYDVVDLAGNRASSNVLVRPLPRGQVNRRPIARPDNIRARAGRPIVIDAARNDNDPDGDAIRIESIAAQPLFGDVRILDNGSLRYRAGPNAEGSDRFEYLLTDARGEKTIGVVLVGVVPADGDNRPPTAADDVYNVVAGGDPLQLGITDNDFDPNSDQITVTEVSGGGRAVELDRRAGTVTFAPPDAVEDERVFTFEYTIDDGRGGRDVGTVNVTVKNADEPITPVAVPDIVGPVLEGDLVTYDVLANDIDVDGKRDELEVSSEDPAVEVSRNGEVEIRAGEESSEHLYRIVDPDGLTSESVITVIATPNRPPITEPLTVETKFETTVEIDVADVVSDPDGDRLTFACCQSIRDGKAENLEAGRGALRVQFTPDARFDGEAGFAYKVNDGEGHLVSGAIVVRVKPPENRKPVIDPKVASVEVEAGTVAPIDLSQWTTDPDVRTGDELDFAVRNAGGAPLERGRGANIEVAPPIDAEGDVYAITYRVTDSFGATADGTVEVTVTPSLIPPPVVVDDSGSTIDSEAISIGVLDNDQGEQLSIIDVTKQSGLGTAAITGEGASAVVYTPQAGESGQAVLNYTVQDVRGTPAGQATGQVIITIIAPPGAPPAPTATADNATAAVQWNSPSANGSEITAFQVRYEGGSAVPVALANSHVFNGLQNGVDYRFQVQAQNAAGWGEWSAYSPTVTPDTEPGQPAAPVVQFADSALIVDWEPPVNDGSAITDYELSISGGMSASITVGTQTSYRWEGLSNGTNYQFSLRALNNAGFSPQSAPSASEHPLTQPGPPTKPAVEVGDRSLVLRWSNGDDGGDDIAYYTVQIDTGQSVRVDGTEYTWGGLNNGQFYRFNVQAYNRDPDPGAPSAWSDQQKPCGKPFAPGSVTAVRGDKQATVSYSAADNNGCDVLSYTIQTNTGLTQTSQSLSKVFDGLQNGQAYQFKVLATNNQGEGAWSGFSNSVTPAGPPFKTPGVTASPTAVRTNTVNWGGADPNGDPISGYEVSVNSGGWTGVGNVTSWNHTGENGATYTYNVRACNSVGCSAEQS
ncbi:MAG: Ig-like domain-containing protein, partial [Actinomycetota bacterium]|nr:Ig-like domain-containing protein [Actinomycetota bacterium]